MFLNNTLKIDETLSQNYLDPQQHPSPASPLAHISQSFTLWTPVCPVPLIPTSTYLDLPCVLKQSLHQKNNQTLSMRCLLISIVSGELSVLMKWVSRFQPFTFYKYTNITHDGLANQILVITKIFRFDCFQIKKKEKWYNYLAYFSPPNHGSGDKAVRRLAHTLLRAYCSLWHEILCSPFTCHKLIRINTILLISLIFPMGATPCPHLPKNIVDIVFDVYAFDICFWRTSFRKLLNSKWA